MFKNAKLNVYREETWRTNQQKNRMIDKISFFVQMKTMYNKTWLWIANKYITFIALNRFSMLSKVFLFSFIKTVAFKIKV